MEDLRWILLGLGVAVLIGLYLFSRLRRDGVSSPFGDDTAHDPLDAPSAPGSRRSEPLIEDITGWTEEGTRPVRRRVLDGEAVSERPAQRRAARFSYESTLRETPSHLPLHDEEPTFDATVNTIEHDADQAAPAEKASVVPVYLVARDPQGFTGAQLIEAFARHGFEFGEMDVYHHADAQGHALFSLMNGIAPGTFDPASLPGQHTPALALFLRLPVHGQPGLVFEQFLDIAHRLAEELDGSLLDERREGLSSEAIDRMREIALGE